jgi:hypothetical protein
VKNNVHVHSFTAVIALAPSVTHDTTFVAGRPNTRKSARASVAKFCAVAVAYFIGTAASKSARNSVCTSSSADGGCIGAAAVRTVCRDNTAVITRHYQGEKRKLNEKRTHECIDLKTMTFLHTVNRQAHRLVVVVFGSNAHIALHYERRQHNIDGALTCHVLIVGAHGVLAFTK